ncbi:hypothetical protein TNCV_1048911 [Trichonephila clavipes]|nr:hypothetical protein TNCV_1048911 [Trichonephila clavipes]
MLKTQVGSCSILEKAHFTNAVRYLLAKVHGTIAICMGTAGGFDEEYCGQMMEIVRVQYFVRGGFVCYRSRASSKASLPSSSGQRARFLGGQKGVVLHLQDARVGVGSTKKPTPLDVDVRRSDVTPLFDHNFYRAPLIH